MNLEEFKEKMYILKMHLSTEKDSKKRLEITESIKDLRKAYARSLFNEEEEKHEKHKRR